MTILDATSIYQRGLADRDALDRFELLVFLVQDLECCADMEGWDHFFIYERPEHCAALRGMLREIGDSISSEIIDDYAEHLRQTGVAFPPPEVPCEACEDDRDWHADFAKAFEQRWDKVAAFLRSHGRELAS